MKQITIADRTVTLYGGGQAPCPVVWLNTFENEGEAVWNACRALHTPDVYLAAIQIDDWNGDLSPWAAPRVYKGDADFAGNADRYLQTLTERILPAVTEQLGEPPLYHAIAGYSLAGLFAVYALYRTEVFRRAASASGSLWYPGFPEFAASHGMPRRPEAVYLSLGDRESRTRNPVMASVQDCTQALYDRLGSLHIPAAFVLNPGNHFQEPDVRMAKGIRWLLEQA